MKADNTRSTFNPHRHYTKVSMQQGRVQLDADWNEQVDIAAHRVETETIDVIGSCGGPMDGAGFALTPQGNNNLQITAGRYYVDGILCENDETVLASEQPDLPPDAKIVRSGSVDGTFPPPAGTYIAYLDVWSRHITALVDPLIREVALGGPDTATRSKTIWQVKFLKVEASGNNCATPPSSWTTLITAPTGQLAARTAPDNPDPNPCIVAPGAGYRRLENQLYRVEIHKLGATGTATFKWSRDNGSIVTAWLGKNNDELTVSSIGRDKVLNFASGQWVELSDDARDLMGQRGTLVRLLKAEGNILTIDPATAIPAGSINLADFAAPRTVRRWDSPGEMAVTIPSTKDGWIPLEDGVEIRFKAGATYRSGDYWLIPARTATADVEWPKNSADDPLPMPPKGIEHHYCRLAVVQFSGGNWSVLDDCRCLFPSLTQSNSLYYVSGDGQEAMPDLTQTGLDGTVLLPQPLVVGVVNPHCRDQRAKVRFKVLIGRGVLFLADGSSSGLVVDAHIDDRGLASCNWRLDFLNWSQQVEATLLDGDNNPIHLPIRFNANLSIADEVAYNPGDCGALGANPKTVTVQQAIDRVVALASLYPASQTNFSLLPNQNTPFQLQVVASSKCGPVAGMHVLFRLMSGGGQVSATDVITVAGGLASCNWTLGAANGIQVVEAELQANASHPTVPPTIVRFTAQRAAIDDPGFHVTGLFLDANIGNPSPPPLRNDMTVSVSQFRNGLQLECNSRVARESIRDRNGKTEKPVCFVTLEIPFFEAGAVDGTGRTMVGFQPVILDGSVTFGASIGSRDEVTLDSDPKKIVWTPTEQAANWIDRLLASLKDMNVVRLLARLTAMGSFIWEDSEEDGIPVNGNPKVYLDGEVFALPDQTKFDLRLPSGDGKRGGDLKMWFWIERSKEPDKTQNKETKEIKETDKPGEKGPKDIDVLKPSDFEKTVDVASPVIVGDSNNSLGPDNDNAAVRHSFIQPEERPAVDASVFDEPLQGPSS